ncbi:unnamed protein product [Vitrella brassicaformis CCMP3155]|uniref:Glutaredoxin domain-containing protein n=2 Tax=Vitrella brassicaformis TaxID=1169539 RepID=A0A0G4EG01_VITBC|nr:unnamed protein product [Vitrella brassicaformis CCMP3155]|eukprot:CEL95451.1 unnamed protein product [Vitrella brassicaformis CCMP3155]
MPDVTIFQYEVCPYCCGLKALLDHNKMPYTAIEVNPLTKDEIKKHPLIDQSPDKKYRKVPIALVNSEQVNDSKNIIDRLADLRGSASPTLKSLDKCSEEEKADIDWAYDKLVILFPPNIYRTLSESYEAFEYMSKSASTWTAWQKLVLRTTGSLFMWLVSPKLKKKYNITDERQELLDAIADWMKRVSDKGGKFRGGESPNMADLIIYGQLSAMRDMTTLKVLQDSNAEFKAWYARCREAVGPSQRRS